jgi:hypothetical protein
MPLNDLVRRTRDYLTGRTRSYRRVFNIQSQDAQAVLEDLAKFCRAHASTGSQGPSVAARLDGRREVWLRIQQHLRLNDEDLWNLFTNPPKG